ncbi:MAG: agmatine deiminase family protein [Gammaproteobacteria bacterium]
MPSARHLPPEWAAQSGVMLTWPHPYGDWAPMLEQVEPVFVRLALAISRRERVLVSCHDATHRDHVAARLRDAGVEPRRVRLEVVPSNDTWARDHGPIIVLQDRQPLLLDFRFDGWGGKYAADLDDRISARLKTLGAFGDRPMREIDLVLEGGAIETDGEGTLLTTESCLLYGHRNPGLGRADVEALLKRELGVRRVLWLRHGHLAGDDTDGHIDTLARFCDADTIAYSSCDDPADEHFDPLQRMQTELQALRRQDGAAYRLVPLPIPAPIRDGDGQRLPATYANFLIINGAVLVPTYDDPADRVALQRLGGCLPGREVVPVNSSPLIRQYGSLHCVTMQLPEGVLAAR